MAVHPKVKALTQIARMIHQATPEDFSNYLDQFKGTDEQTLPDTYQFMKKDQEDLNLPPKKPKKQK